MRDWIKASGSVKLGRSERHDANSLYSNIQSADWSGKGRIVKDVFFFGFNTVALFPSSLISREQCFRRFVGPSPVEGQGLSWHVSKQSGSSLMDTRYYRYSYTSCNNLTLIQSCFSGFPTAPPHTQLQVMFSQVAFLHPTSRRTHTLIHQSGAN